MSLAKGVGVALHSVELARFDGAGCPPQILVEIVDLPGRPDPRCVLLCEPASPQARSYRLLRHRLLTRSDPRVIAVTSALGGEGKTTCAVNLALCIAEETLASVLLLEANPRRPSVARVFGMGPLPESAREGIGDAAWTSQYRIFAFRGPRLHVASASACAVHTGGLDRLLLDVALRDLRAMYDYIIVDTASVLESADADVACECADGVLVAARARESRRGPLERAIEQIRPATICGLVLLDV